VRAEPFRLSLKPVTTRGFTGHEQLDEMGLIHMNGRVYDARLGRFIQADPLIQDPTKVQSLNRYSYVWNNPLNATDPSGFVCEGQACMDTRPEDNKPIERIVVRGTQPDSAMQRHHEAMQRHLRNMVMEGISHNAMSGTVAGGNISSEKGFLQQLAEDIVAGFEMMASNPFAGIAEAQQDLRGAELSGDEATIEQAQLALYSTIATVVVVSATPGPATGGKTKVDSKSVVKKELHRPYIRKHVRQNVESRAKRMADGRFRDANTGKPIDGKYDLGHRRGREFRREKAKAEAEGLNQKQFNDRMNNPDLYQIEHPSLNRSRKFEKP